MKRSEIMAMINSTKCIKVVYPIMLANNYTKQQLKTRMEEIKARKNIKAREREYEKVDFKISIINSIWNLCGACDDLINCRIDVEKQIFMEKVEKKMIPFEKGKKRSFEQSLAMDVIKKYGDDVERNVLIRAKEYVASINKKHAERIVIPELKRDPNAELKDLADVKKYIYDKVVAHYKGEFDYPPREEQKVSEVETIGV